MIANPILLKEVRGTLRNRRFFLALFITLLVLAGAFLLACFTQTLDRDMDPATLGRLLHWTCVATMAAAILLVFPAFSATAIGMEREQRTLELVLISRLSPWQIVWGKLSACLFYAVLFLCGTVPMVLLAFLMGGVGIWEALASFLGLGLLALAVSACCLGLSAQYKGTRAAIIGSYLLTLVLFVPSLGAYGVSLYESMERGRMGGAEQAYLLLEIPLASVLVLTALSLVLAVRALQPPAAKQEAPLRLYFPALGLLISALAWQGVGLYASPHDKKEGLVVLLFLVLLYALGWILFFSADTPRPSKRAEAQARRWARFPLARLLAPGAARGAAYGLLAGILLLMGNLAVYARFFPPVELRPLIEGALLGVSAMLYVAGLGYFLGTLMRPGLARALGLSWLVLTSVIPHSAWVIREARDDGTKFPPAWSLPTLSIPCALVSWIRSLSIDAKMQLPEEVWRGWSGILLHREATLLLGALGLVFWLWAERRRRR